MLDIKFIRENVDKIKKAVSDKNIKIDINRLLEVDKSRSATIREIEGLKTEQNKLSKVKPDQETITMLKESKNKIIVLEQELKNIDEEYFDLMVKVPTVPSLDVPYGKNDN
ncbi:MAG: serine--tRNA ligase, partial [Patescibacteria group bacterium]